MSLEKHVDKSVTNILLDYYTTCSLVQSSTGAVCHMCDRLLLSVGGAWVRELWEPKEAPEPSSPDPRDAGPLLKSPLLPSTPGVLSSVTTGVLVVMVHPRGVILNSGHTQDTL